VFPQRQAPALQLSAWMALQAKQVAPPVPHVADAGVLHVVPVQQPLAHDVASHTHSPPTQCCPPSHAALPPQVHCPAAEHASARAASHWTQAAPPVPHEANEDPLQVVPLQQPSAQAQVEQTPPVQVSPAGQAEHASPAPPHASEAVPG